MNSTKSESSINGRLVSIDALRGVAALGVVLYHALLQTTNAVPNNLFQWPVKGLQFVSSFGYIGVFLFFVISGFCIHLQWARARAAGQEAQLKFGAFWKRRVRRLYPPYLIALGLFIGMAAWSTGINITHVFVYDLVMHLLMLHNLDPATCYSINGVFWTLAIEEQLYLGYFLLLFLRQHWGWGPTLIICALARLGWFLLSHAIWLGTGVGVPVPEAAASHWFTWALGALAVEASFGLIQLPRWCRNIKLGGVAVVAASAISFVLPQLPKDTLVHDGAWLLMHPLWGFGFFVLVNAAVSWERLSWDESGARTRSLSMARLVTIAASIGVFSYSLYLTHELVIMHSWRFYVFGLPPIVSTLLLTIPSTIGFAWLFFRFCEKPYLRRVSEQKTPRQEVSEEVLSNAIPLTEEG
jgi:peptidoglycan/LPS O-acetylase OafA/YrhL